MNKNKGFTLVELLAVIVILAIIALIATPIILNVISDAKKQAALESFKGYIDGAEKAIVLNEFEDEKDTTFPDPDSNGCYNLKDLDKKINIKGTKPTIVDGSKACFESGVVTSITGLTFSGYEVRYTKDKGYEINGKVVEKDDKKELTGIPSEEYNQGQPVSYLGYNWLVMKDNGNNTQLVMDGYLSESEIYENYPTDIDQSLKNKWTYVCPVLGYSKQSSNYDETRNNFLSKVENYCYTIWNGVSNEISEYTWNKSVIKKILENWINNKMAKKEFNKEIELKGMTFNDGIEQSTGYVRIPTRDEIDKDGVYLAQITNSSMITDYSYLTLTACERASNGYQKIYIYNASYQKTAFPTELGSINGNDMKVRPVITVNEK